MVTFSVIVWPGFTRRGAWTRRRNATRSPRRVSISAWTFETCGVRPS